MLTENKEPIDIDLSDIQKQPFRINGNNDQILELNISDMGIVNRVAETLPKLKSLAEEAADLKASEIEMETDSELPSESDEFLLEIGKKINELDDRLRDYIDYIFDSNVSEVCAPSGTMFDLFKGKFRYEYLLDKLTKLYTDNIQSEYDKVRQRMAMHTDKYVKKSKKRK